MPASGQILTLPSEKDLPKVDACDSHEADQLRHHIGQVTAVKLTGEWSPTERLDTAVRRLAGAYRLLVAYAVR